MARINARQQMFIDEYLKSPNATQAALKAGYAKKGAHTQGSRLLQNVAIKAEMELRRSRVSDDADLELSEVVRELRGILSADIVDAMHEDGTLKPLSQWPQPLRAALSGIDNQEIMAGTKGGKICIGRLRKVRFWSKTAAAEQLMKHLGGFKADQHIEPSDERVMTINLTVDHKPINPVRNADDDGDDDGDMKTVNTFEI